MAACSATGTSRRNVVDADQSATGHDHSDKNEIDDERVLHAARMVAEGFGSRAISTN